MPDLLQDLDDEALAPRAEVHFDLDVVDKPGGSLHGERANFTGLVLGCAEAKCCK